MTYVIGEPCVDIRDKACVDECPVDCIYEGERMLYIHPDECVDCAACEPVCPVEAIIYVDDATDDWQPYVAANADFFRRVGGVTGRCTWIGQAAVRCTAGVPVAEEGYRGGLSAFVAFWVGSVRGGGGRCWCRR